MSIGLSQEFYFKKFQAGDHFYVKESNGKRLIGFSSLPEGNVEKRAQKLALQIQQHGIAPLVHADLKGRKVQLFRRDTLVDNLTKLFQENHKPLLHDISWSLVEGNIGMDHLVPFSREECCDLIAPDVTFIVEGKELKAHRSILHAYTYWSKITNFKEGAEGRIEVKDCSYDEFQILLNWLYTGSVEWSVIPTLEDDKNTLRRAFLANCMLLERLSDIADKYDLSLLSEWCKKTLDRVVPMGASLNWASNGALVAFFQKCPRPPRPAGFFAKPASEQFYDVTFKWLDVPIKTNRLLAASQSHTLRNLLLQQNPQLQISTDQTGMDQNGFTLWLQKLTEGTPVAHTQPLSAVKGLKLAHSEKDRFLKELICEMMTLQNLLPPLTAEEILLVDHLTIAALPSEILKESRLKIRTLKVSLPNHDRFNLELNQLKTWLKENGKELRSITFGNDHFVEDSFLEWVATHCPNLEELNLQACTNFLTDRALLEISHHCPKLKKISLYGMGDTGLVALAMGCKSLQDVTLIGSNIGNLGISTLAKNCQLRTLNLPSCTNIDDEAILAIAQTQPMLQSLNLSNCAKVTDHALQELLKMCPELKTVDLMMCSLLTDKTALNIANQCLQLHTLKINKCPNISLTAVDRILAQCPQLKLLGFSGDAWNALKETYPHCKIEI